MFPTSETPEREPEKCDVDIGWPMAETVSEPLCPSCVARWYFNWPTRLVWAFLMMFTGGTVAAGPLALLFHRLDPPSAVGYLLVLPFAVAFFRGMRLGFKTTKLGLEVRNPWRNYRFTWSEVAAITDFQPGR
jgi:hypothetical protein